MLQAVMMEERSPARKRSAPKLTAQSIVDKRVSEDTKDQYDRYCDKIKLWLSTHHPQYVVNNILRIELIPLSVIEELFEYQQYHHGSDGEPLSFVSKSRVDFFRKAIVHQFKKNGIDTIPKELSTFFTAYFKGYSKVVATERDEGRMNEKEGKDPLSAKAYRHLAALALSCQDPNQGLFVGPYLNLEWNLSSRVASTGNVLQEHIQWQGDCLLVTHYKHKGDQAGEVSSKEPKHIYANPKEPMICPILGLGLLAICQSYRPSASGGGNRLFASESSDTRFSTWLHTALKRLTSEESQAWQLYLHRHATHSIRKGILSALSGCIQGPPPVNIYKRGGLAYGTKVGGKYLLGTPAGDQFVGRAACGLSLYETDFAILPPHFTPAAKDILSTSLLMEIFPGYATFPSTYKTAIPFLLASVVYHKAWLRDNLPKNHLLFQSWFWKNNYSESLAALVHCGTFTCTECFLTCTGVPPTVYQQKQSSDIMEMVAEIRDAFRSERETPFSPIPAAPSFAPVTPTVSSGGQVANQLAAMQAQLSSLTDLISARSGELRSSAVTDAVTPTSAPCAVPLSTSPSTTKLFSWNDGTVHMVPEGFCLQSVTIKTLWDMWWLGIPNEEIGPLHKLRGGDIPNRTADKVQFSRARTVMAGLITIAKEEGCITDQVDPTCLDYHQLNALFAALYPTLSVRVNGTLTPDKKKYKRRIHECLFTTVAAQISKK